MTRRIPAWLVGFIGVSIVLLSTVFSSIFWSKLDAEIQAKQKARAELTGKINSMWDSHKLGDARSGAADQFLGVFLVGRQNPEFFLPQIGRNLRGAVLAMMAAAGKAIPKDPPRN